MTSTLFLSVAAFYLGLSIQAFSSEYVWSLINMRMLMQSLEFLWIFSGACTVLIGIVALLTRPVTWVHYLLLSVLFVLEVGMSWIFWEAMFFL